MATAAREPVSVAVGSAGTDTEEARVRLQDRLRLHAGWVLVLVFGFFILTGMTSFAIGLPWLLHPSTLWLLTTTAIVGTSWLLARGRLRSERVLRWLDAGALVLTCFCLAILGAILAFGPVDFVEDPAQALLVAQLSCTCVILARAVLI